MDVYERLDELDSDKAETKAARILCGLGKPSIRLKHDDMILLATC